MNSHTLTTMTANSDHVGDARIPPLRPNAERKPATGLVPGKKAKRQTIATTIGGTAQGMATAARHIRMVRESLHIKTASPTARTRCPPTLRTVKITLFSSATRKAELDNTDQ